MTRPKLKVPARFDIGWRCLLRRCCGGWLFLLLLLFRLSRPRPMLVEQELLLGDPEVHVLLVVHAGVEGQHVGQGAEASSLLGLLVLLAPVKRVVLGMQMRDDKDETYLSHQAGVVCSGQSDEHTMSWN